MEIVLNICAVVTLLVIGISFWQAFQIVKKGNQGEQPSEDEMRRLERRLNVIHVSVYVMVVILVFHFCLPYISG